MNAERKVSLRHILRAARRAHVWGLDAAEGAAQAAALAVQLAPLLAAAEIVASYAVHGAEMDPSDADTDAAILAFPRIGGDGQLSFHACSRAALVDGARGIPAPPSDAPEVIPDLVLVPLIAATLAGDRLGQGSGHYDRTLARLRAHGPVTTVGIAWPVQIVADLPVDPWDVPLDWIATPTQLFRCGDADIGADDPAG